VKIDIPKNLWISSAETEIFHEGSLNGFYGLHLTFSGHPLGSAELMAEILEPLTKVKLPRRKFVVFSGIFNPQDPMYSVAVKAFQSWKFWVIAQISDDSLSLPWLHDVNWIILQTKKNFIPVAVNEIWYTPEASEEVPDEPQVPNPESTQLFLSKGYSVAISTKFLVEARNVWRIL